jgi:hypothetical protein
MAKLSGSALKRARLVPSAVFASPDAVVRAETLSRAQKIQILRRWEFDLRPTGRLLPNPGDAQDNAAMLGQLKVALAALGADRPLASRRPAPTRH